YGGEIKDWRAIESTIRSVPGVESVAPFTYQQALLRNDRTSSGVLIRGIQQGSASADQLSEYLDGNQRIEKLFNPEPLELKDSNGDPQTVTLPGIVVGKELARSMGLLVGSPVSLLSPQVSSTPFGLVPRFKRFVVTATYSSGLVEYESGLAYITLEDAQRFFRLEDAISGFEIRVDHIELSPKIASAIMDALGGFGSGFYAQDWTEQNKPLWEAIHLEKRVYFLVLQLIIVMASFSIISSLIMIVLEKRKDIAILKTMGASTRSIANIFMLQGMVIGLCGTLSGLLLGYAGCVALEHYGFPLPEGAFPMKTLPVRIDLFSFFLVGLVAFVICCIATLYPAIRASRLDPCEVMRYE
ncbi:MAG: ABC transporter permease, partial [Bdellovibrionales bacterium]|nr:ABC transporter permease [Bdellovibrionales bacterium]